MPCSTMFSREIVASTWRRPSAWRQQKGRRCSRASISGKLKASSPAVPSSTSVKIAGTAALACTAWVRAPLSSAMIALCNQHSSTSQRHADNAATQVPVIRVQFWQRGNAGCSAALDPCRCHLQHCIQIHRIYQRKHHVWPRDQHWSTADPIVRQRAQRATGKRGQQARDSRADPISQVLAIAPCQSNCSAPKQRAACQRRILQLLSYCLSWALTWQHEFGGLCEWLEHMSHSGRAPF